MQGTSRVLIPEELYDRLAVHLLQNATTTGIEEAALLFAHPVITSNHVGLIIAHWVPVPPEAFRVQRDDQFAIAHEFIVHQTKQARIRGESLLLAHSHPADQNIPAFSAADRRGEADLSAFLAHRIPHRPHGVLVLSPGGAAAAIQDEQGRRSEAEVRIVGRRSTLISSHPRYHDDPWHARQEILWGSHGQGILQHARVGVIGAGGTGSLVVQQLMHMGVGTLVVIDPDVVTASNLARIPGAQRADIEQTAKVAIVARTAASLDPAVQIYPIARDVCQPEVLQELLGLDLWFLCTHGHYSRAVVSTASVQYAVPLVDVGFSIQMNPAGKQIASAMGEIRLVVPGGYCLQCAGILDAERIRQEKVHPEERLAHPAYFTHLDVPDPSVMTINSVLAGQAVMVGLDMLVPTLGSVAVTDSWRYNARKGLLSREMKAYKTVCPLCGSEGVRWQGDDLPLPL